MRNPIFNTLDVISDIDYCYFCISEIVKWSDEEHPDKDKNLIKGYEKIIRLKRKIGYTYEEDRRAIKDIKAKTKTLTQDQANFINQKLNSLELFLSAHPENVPDSEMADRLDDVVEMKKILKIYFH